MIGPVQENDTSAKVKAIRNMDSNPVVCSDLASIFVDHEAGKESSNAPKNEAAKTTSNIQKKMLNKALVASALSALAPNSSVTANPKST